MIGMTLTLAALQTLPADLLARRDAQEIADAYNADPANAEVAEYWLTDRGLVADLVIASGGTDLSDSILNKFDAAMAASRSAKAQINRLYNDANGLNFGDPALRAWFVAHTPDVFTEAERDALLALAVRPASVSEYDVRRLCWSDNGFWLA